MNTRYIDWIWNVRGSVALAPGQSVDDAFQRLDPLFHEYGTTHARADNALSFSKQDQPAQDKMSVFDRGVLCIEQGAAGAVLRYRLMSKSLLFCFLVPLLFLGFAQLAILAATYEKAPAAAAQKADKSKEDKAKEAMFLQQNPIDKWLGAPAPEKPKADGSDRRRGRKPSPTAAYVFASLFAALYVVGRVLEDRMVKNLFQRRLAEG